MVLLKYVALTHDDRAALTRCPIGGGAGADLGDFDRADGFDVSYLNETLAPFSTSVTQIMAAEQRKLLGEFKLQS